MAVFIILFVLSFVVAGVHIYRDEQPRTGGRVAEILLIWLLVINIGFGGLYAFSGHLFAADEVAASIGWPAGNPFQTEVAAVRIFSQVENDNVTAAAAIAVVLLAISLTVLLIIALFERWSRKHDQ